jgi:hypothetical protein
VIGIALVVCGTPFINKNLDKTNFNSFFTIPASNFERWLLLWAKSVLIMPILVAGTIFLLNWISPSLAVDKIISTGHIAERIYVLLAYQSIFFSGYIYFRERSFIKSAMAIATLFIFIYFISKLIISQFYPEVAKVHESLDIMNILNFDGFYDRVTKNYVETGTTTTYEVCLWIVRLIFPVGLWVVSYIRLRETEI